MKYACLLILLCLGFNLWAQAVGSFGADFSRSVIQDSTSEQSSGKLRIQFPADVMVFVESPIKQWLHYASDHLLIYYPQENRLFRLDKSASVAPPFVSSVISALKEDFGLSELGFTILDSQALEDTLLVRWLPPDSLRQSVGRVELRYEGSKLISSSTYDARDSLVLDNAYHLHHDHRGYQIPLWIKSWQRTPTGGKTELLEYRDPVFDLDYSPLLRQFELLEQRSLTGQR